MSVNLIIRVMRQLNVIHRFVKPCLLKTYNVIEGRSKFLIYSRNFELGAGQILTVNGHYIKFVVRTANVQFRN